MPTANRRPMQTSPPSPQSLVQSLSKSYDIVKAQRKDAKAQLQVLQAKLDKQQQQQQQPLHEPTRSQGLEDLQLKLVDLNNKVLDIDISVKAVTEEVASCLRPHEKEIHSTRLVRRERGPPSLPASASSLAHLPAPLSLQLHPLPCPLSLSPPMSGPSRPPPPSSQPPLSWVR